MAIRLRDVNSKPYTQTVYAKPVNTDQSVYTVNLEAALLRIAALEASVAILEAERNAERKPSKRPPADRRDYMREYMRKRRLASKA